MIVYHGTTLEDGREIQRSGLVPKINKEFLAARSDSIFGTLPLDLAKERFFYNKRQAPSTPAVYVTTNRKVAEVYAGFRSRYNSAKYGELIPWSSEVTMYKLGREQKKSIPAIVTIELPENWHLENDPESPAVNQSFLSPFAIPAKYVRSVTPVGNRVFNDWSNDGGNRVPHFD